MKSPDIVEKVRDGDIVFFSGGHKNLIRRVITWFTNGPHYHVGIAFWIDVEGSKKLMLAESQPDGFRIINIDQYDEREWTVVAAPVAWSKLSEKVINGTGKIGYDFVDLAKIGLHEKFGIDMPDFTGPGEVCSALIAKFLQESGVDIKDTLVSPEKLLNTLLDMGYFTRR